MACVACREGYSKHIQIDVGMNGRTGKDGKEKVGNRSIRKARFISDMRKIYMSWYLITFTAPNLRHYSQPRTPFNLSRASCRSIDFSRSSSNGWIARRYSSAVNVARSCWCWCWGCRISVSASVVGASEDWAVQMDGVEEVECVV